MDTTMKMESFTRTGQSRVQSCQKQIRQDIEQQWENAGIEDNFIFFKVMQDKELCLELLRRIFPTFDIVAIKEPEQEKILAFTQDAKSIRMDLLVKEVADSGSKEIVRVYNIEMQIVSSSVLPMRSRYYQSMLDVGILERGAGYKELMPSFVIFICPKDVFGDDRIQYTFKNICEETGKPLGDNREIIFINASGSIGYIEDGLQNFLDFMNNGVVSDKYTKLLNNEIEKFKMNKDVKGEYVKMITERSFLIAEGEEVGRRETAKRMLKLGKLTHKEIVMCSGLTLEEVAALAKEL